MAQGFLQSFDKSIEVHSAGTEPADQINKTAVIVMQEAGIDISQNKPKSVDKYLNDKWDYVITVCDQANETCPVFAGKAENRLHFGFEDPSNFKGSDMQIMSEFRRIRDEIRIAFYKFYNDFLV
jgi:arsenate reductase (thioredoxin)